MKVLTGNDLKTGDVIWWTGSGWSRHVDDAADAGERAEEILATEEAARRVNVPYTITATREENGHIRPAHIKDRVRALGPTVRPDLTLKPQDPEALDWVI
ncbi:DUF2849 domain-containing protein [Erythrobacter insulae]|uniref:DUF2849 domain-containing protein n=1 Tax=Erythrobacter insulae TaxID=2584124 RepID=A0A547P973_9SPHN|nr:DUF2849 domain-containing protein [Erythrobacter insulae]TRD10689.1 DUF2849 domain-containing protein [Erythrobacter insulae]